MEGTHRLYIHGRVNPNQPGDLEAMDELASRHRIAAWKTYTQFGPDGKGFFLDDEVGTAFVEKARKLGVRNIAVHKGFPFGQKSYEHSTCVDVGRAARRFPDVNFLIYHSGFVAEKKEGPHDPKRADGIDALVTSLAENNVKPGSNVYAELGSTWRFLMRDPDSAAHALGKLFKACGEDNVLLGHGLDLVRLSPGSDPGLPHVPDRAGAAREARLSGDDAAATREGFRPQRAEDLSGAQGNPRQAPRQGPGGARPRRIPRESRSRVPHLRAEDAARVPRAHGLRHAMIAHPARLSPLLAPIDHDRPDFRVPRRGVLVREATARLPGLRPAIAAIDPEIAPSGGLLGDAYFRAAFVSRRRHRPEGFDFTGLRRSGVAMDERLLAVRRRAATRSPNGRARTGSAASARPACARAASAR
jgi:hypothetical protein